MRPKRPQQKTQTNPGQSSLASRLPLSLLVSLPLSLSLAFVPVLCSLSFIVHYVTWLCVGALSPSLAVFVCLSFCSVRVSSCLLSLFLCFKFLLVNLASFTQMVYAACYVCCVLCLFAVLCCSPLVVSCLLPYRWQRHGLSLFVSLIAVSAVLVSVCLFPHVSVLLSPSYISLNLLCPVAFG